MSEDKTLAQNLSAEQKEADEKATKLAHELKEKNDTIVNELYAILVKHKVAYSDFMYLIYPELINKANNFVETRSLDEFEITDDKKFELNQRKRERQ